MCTPVATVAAAPPVAVPRIVRLLDNDLLLVLLLPAYQECKEGCYQEKYAIHNPQCKARLQKPARLPRANRICTGCCRKRDVPEGIGSCVAARLVTDKAQLIYSADQRANEAQVDEGDESGVGVRAVVGEQCVDRPTSP